MSGRALSTDCVLALLSRARKLGLAVAEPTATPPSPFVQISFDGPPEDAVGAKRTLSRGSISGRWVALRALSQDGLYGYIGIPLACEEQPDGHTEAFAERLAADLTAGVEEQAIVEVSQRNLDMFTRELDQAYENLSLVYRLGRQASQFEEPLAYFELATGELRELLDFGWCALLIDEDAKRLGSVTGRRVLSNRRSDAPDLLPTLVEYLARASMANAEGVVVCAESGLGTELVVHPLRSGDDRAGWLVLGDKAPGHDGDAGVTSVDTQAAEAVAGCVSNVLESLRLYHEQQLTFVGTLRAFSRSLDAKDRYTRGHSDRVALLAKQLTLAMGGSEKDASVAHLAGVLHDIGKMGVPDAVLRKPSRLTDEEFDQIKQHPRLGYEILKAIPAVEAALPGVMHHHERFDGRGYPAQLEGESIPPIARVLALADAFDAMSSSRAYRPAMPREAVLEEIRKGAGTQFDAALTEAFLQIDLTEFDAMLNQHREDDPEAPQDIAA